MKVEIDSAVLTFHTLIRHVRFSAGTNAWDFSSRVSGLDTATIPARYLAKGSYFGLTGKAPFRHLIYPVPEPGGLGIHLTLDLAGQARFGPDVEWIDRISYDVDPQRGQSFYASIRRYWPGLHDGASMPAYSGIEGEDDSSRSRARRFRHPGSERNRPSGLHRALWHQVPGADCVAGDR